jgi:glucose-6-phosphate isomerase
VFLIASKTFTTIETMTNALSAQALVRGPCAALRDRGHRAALHRPDH